VPRSTSNYIDRCWCQHAKPALKSIGVRPSGDVAFHDNATAFPSSGRRDEHGQTGATVPGCGRAMRQCLSDANKSRQRVPENRLRIADGVDGRRDRLDLSKSCLTPADFRVEWEGARPGRRQRDEGADVRHRLLIVLSYWASLRWRRQSTVIISVREFTRKVCWVPRYYLHHFWPRFCFTAVCLSVCLLVCYLLTR